MTRPARRWFIWLAPLTVPAYLIYLAALSGFACCYYITIEQTLELILRRFRRADEPSAALAGWPVWVTVPLAILLMPLAVLIHVTIWLIRQFIWILISLGRWQAA